MTAIVGTNGAGKTTMMKAELGLIPIAHGGITVLGKPAGAMNHRIGYVPQSYASDIESNITAEQSVLLGLTGARFGIHPITRLQKDKVRNALEFVDMQDKARYRLSELSGACGNASPSRRRWCRTPNCSCWMNRSPILIWPANVPRCTCSPNSTENSACPFK